MVPAPGIKWSRPCASWGAWGALLGQNGISEDLLGPPDTDFLFSELYHPHHRHQGPKGIDHMPPEDLGEHSLGKMGYQAICYNTDN